MKKFIVLIVLFVISGMYKAQAQIGLAVAKENGSVVEWRVAWNEGTAWDCKMAARKYLINKGHDNVYTQDGNDCCGHTTTSGYWVLVKGRGKSYDGTYKTEYGLGASSSSYADAETKAVKNLDTYANVWSRSDGYTVDRKGEF